MCSKSKESGFSERVTKVDNLRKVILKERNGPWTERCLFVRGLSTDGV
jgi:hypothetical protein